MHEVISSTQHYEADIIFFGKFFFIFETHTHISVSGGGAEREGDTESKAGFRL